MSARTLSYVMLRDYRLPRHAGWAISLVHLGFAGLRAYLENPENLRRAKKPRRFRRLRRTRSKRRTPRRPVSWKPLAGDLFDQMHRASPGVHIDLDGIPDERLLYYGWRFPIKTRTTTKRAA